MEKFYLIKENKVVGISNRYTEAEGATTIKHDFTEDQEKRLTEGATISLKVIDGEVEYQKSEMIDQAIKGSKKTLKVPALVTKFLPKYFVTITDTEESKSFILKEKINQINREFDEIIDDYLSKYSRNEITEFTEKKLEAKEVISWGDSVYISGKAKALGITPLDFAKIIIAKNNEYTIMYTNLENEKDAKIEALTK